MPSNMMKALFISSFIAGTSSAFQTQPGFSPQRLHDTAIAATINNNPTTEESLSTSRRNILQGAGVAMTALLGGTVLSQPAEAKYSTYTRYEEDWKERQEKGEIKISTASDLRRALREVAPMNDEGSKIFCPNGPSAAVSPLMENKCGDRQALPSVFGRTDDGLGNSVPGFGGAAPSVLRAELDKQAYFRET